MQSFAVNGKLPRCVLIVHVESVYFHCSKAIVRSKLWDEATKIDRKSLPSTGTIHRRAEPGQGSAARQYDREVPEQHQGAALLTPFHPHLASNSRMCSGTGASTFTAGLFLEIGTVTARACRCSGGPPWRGAPP